MNTGNTRSDEGLALPVLTVLGVAVAIVVAFVGSGALGGTSIAEAAGGALSADATPAAPAGSAFAIWSVIYLGLVAYALWQLSPGARRSARQRVLRPWVLASALLNALWIWTVQWGLVALSVVVIIVLLAVLIRIMFLLGAPRTGGAVESVVTDGTFGLYLGWVSVAFLANFYAWAVAAGAMDFGGIPLGVVGVLVAAGIGVATARLSGGRIAPALATGWGLAWVAAGRASGEHESTLLVVLAAAAAVTVVVAAVSVAAAARR